MKTPRAAMRHILYERLNNGMEQTEKIIQLFDRFSVWIVGFSMAKISYIIINGQDFQEISNPLTAIKVLLTISIFSGIIYRLAFTFMQILEYQRS